MEAVLLRNWHLSSDLLGEKGISQGKAVARGGMGGRIFFKKKSMSQHREKGMGVCRELKGHCGWKSEN